jgi:hypothetical protein
MGFGKEALCQVLDRYVKVPISNFKRRLATSPSTSVEPFPWPVDVYQGSVDGSKDLLL